MNSYSLLPTSILVSQANSVFQLRLVYRPVCIFISCTPSELFYDALPPGVTRTPCTMSSWVTVLYFPTSQFIRKPNTSRTESCYFYRAVHAP